MSQTRLQLDPIGPIPLGSPAQEPGVAMDGGQRIPQVVEQQDTQVRRAVGGGWLYSLVRHTLQLRAGAVRHELPPRLGHRRPGRGGTRTRIRVPWPAALLTCSLPPGITLVNSEQPF